MILKLWSFVGLLGLSAGDCPEGYGYNSETQTCFQCEAGTYMSYVNTTEDLTFSVGCRPCPAGEFSAAAASECSTCPAGRHSWAQSAACTYCEAGKYSPAGVRDCILCPPGLFSPSAGFSECLKAPTAAATLGQPAAPIVLLVIGAKLAPNVAQPALLASFWMRTRLAAFAQLGLSASKVPCGSYSWLWKVSSSCSSIVPVYIIVAIVHSANGFLP